MWAMKNVYIYGMDGVVIEGQTRGVYGIKDLRTGEYRQSVQEVYNLNAFKELARIRNMLNGFEVKEPTRVFTASPTPIVSLEESRGMWIYAHQRKHVFTVFAGDYQETASWRTAVPKLSVTEQNTRAWERARQKLLNKLGLWEELVSYVVY